jgi:hypothetical protein
VKVWVSLMCEGGSRLGGGWQLFSYPPLIRCDLRQIAKKRVRGTEIRGLELPL